MASSLHFLFYLSRHPAYPMSLIPFHTEIPRTQFINFEEKAKQFTLKMKSETFVLYQIHSCSSSKLGQYKRFVDHFFLMSCVSRCRWTNFQGSKSRQPIKKGPDPGGHITRIQIHAATDRDPDLVG